MAVRPATVWDILPAVDMGLAYIEEAGAYSGLNFNQELAAGMMVNSIQDPNYLFLISTDRQSKVTGMLWAACAPLLPWSDDLIANDLIVYVRPEYRGTRHGLDLIKQYQDWAFSLGAKEVRLSVASGIHEEKTGRLYNKLGYEHLGSQYRRKQYVT